MIKITTWKKLKGCNIKVAWLQKAREFRPNHLALYENLEKLKHDLFLLYVQSLHLSKLRVDPNKPIFYEHARGGKKKCYTY